MNGLHSPRTESSHLWNMSLLEAWITLALLFAYSLLPSASALSNDSSQLHTWILTVWFCAIASMNQPVCPWICIFACPYIGYPSFKVPAMRSCLQWLSSTYHCLSLSPLWSLVRHLSLAFSMSYTPKALSHYCLSPSFAFDSPIATAQFALSIP